jgi:heat shock protein HtpX
MYSEISANKRKSVYIMLAFFTLVGLLAYGIGMYFQDFSYTVMVAVFAFFYIIWSYFAAGKAVLALNGAKEIQKRDNPRLFRIVENLAITNGMPTPKVYIIEDNGLNAFATGRDPQHASVAATSGILEALNDNELEGVMAHELGHIQNYDIRVSVIAFALVGVVAIVADLFWRISFFNSLDDDSPAGGVLGLVVFIVVVVLAPIAATLLQLAISRKREYLADATGALTTRYPEALASALEKIQAQGSTVKRQNSSTAHFFFASPLKKKAGSSLFSTHPPVEERIKRLRSMGTHQ